MTKGTVSPDPLIRIRDRAPLRVVDAVFLAIAAGVRPRDLGGPEGETLGSGLPLHLGDTDDGPVARAFAQIVAREIGLSQDNGLIIVDGRSFSCGDVKAIPDWAVIEAADRGRLIALGEVKGRNTPEHLAHYGTSCPMHGEEYVSQSQVYRDGCWTEERHRKTLVDGPHAWLTPEPTAAPQGWVGVDVVKVYTEAACMLAYLHGGAVSALLTRTADLVWQDKWESTKPLFGVTQAEAETAVRAAQDANSRRQVTYDKLKAIPGVESVIERRGDGRYYDDFRVSLDNGVGVGLKTRRGNIEAYVIGGTLRGFSSVDQIEHLNAEGQYLVVYDCGERGTDPMAVVENLLKNVEKSP